MKAAAQRVKLAVALAADSIRKKFNQLYTDRKETNRLLEEQYKPITKKFDTFISTNDDRPIPRSLGRRRSGGSNDSGDGGGGGSNLRRTPVQLPEFHDLNMGSIEGINNDFERIRDDIESERLANVSNQLVAENERQQDGMNNSVIIDIPETYNDDDRNNGTLYVSPMDTSSDSEKNKRIRRSFQNKKKTSRCSRLSRTTPRKLSSIDDDSDEREKSDIDMVESKQLPQSSKRASNYEDDSVIEQRGKSIRLSASRKTLIRNKLAREQELENVKQLRDDLAAASEPTTPPVDWQALIQHSAETKKERMGNKKREQNASYIKTSTRREDRKRRSEIFQDPLVSVDDATNRKQHQPRKSIPFPIPPQKTKIKTRQALVTDLMKQVKRPGLPVKRITRSQSVSADIHTGLGLFNMDVKKANGFDKTCSNMIMYWNDPNELVNRLRLLVASTSAGHTSHNNEITALIEELREANIIE